MNLCQTPDILQSRISNLENLPQILPPENANRNKIEEESPLSMTKTKEDSLQLTPKSKPVHPGLIIEVTPTKIGDVEDGSVELESLVSPPPKIGYVEDGLVELDSPVSPLKKLTIEEKIEQNIPKEMQELYRKKAKQDLLMKISKSPSGKTISSPTKIVPSMKPKDLKTNEPEPVINLNNEPIPM